MVLTAQGRRLVRDGDPLWSALETMLAGIGNAAAEEIAGLAPYLAVRAGTRDDIGDQPLGVALPARHHRHIADRRMVGQHGVDLAQLDPTTGAMTLLGPITGPEDLRSVPLFGLAIAAPAPCPTGVATAQVIPAGSPTGYALLGALLALFAVFGLRRRVR